MNDGKKIKTCMDKPLLKKKLNMIIRSSLENEIKVKKVVSLKKEILFLSAM